MIEIALKYLAYCGICGRQTEHQGLRCKVCGT